MRESLVRIWAVMVKELRQLRRDKLTFAMIVGIPLMQILLFGYAINLDVRHLRAGVVDGAGTAASRQLVREVQASQVVDVVVRQGSVGDLQRELRNGNISVGLYIPPDFERRLADGDRAAAQLLIDGSEPAIIGVAAQLQKLPLTLHGEPPATRPGLFATRTLYNPEQRSAVQIVPALIGVILTLTMVLFTAIAIVRERERGNLELLITTPVKTPELMAGKILPYIVIGLVQVSIVLAVGALLFNVPIRGSLWDLYLASLVFIAASLGLGLLISTVAKTQFQAVQLTVFTFLPSILLSGFMFPFDGMPKFAQWLGEILPLTHFVRLIRGIVLRGATVTGMGEEVLALLVFFAITMTLAVIKFQKRLD